MTNTNSEKRKAVIAKIQALIQKTTDNGCTEAEALAAATKVNRLLEEYDLSYSAVNAEAEAKGEKYGARMFLFDSKITHQLASWIMVSLCSYFNCKCYTHTDPVTREKGILIFGSEDESLMVKNMMAMLIMMSESELRKYKKSPDCAQEHGRTIRASFMGGMGQRIAERFRQMKRERDDAANTHAKSVTGTSLVVIKDKIVVDKYRTYLKQKGIKLRSGYSSSTIRSEGARSAGRAAGSRADLGASKKVGGGPARLTTR